MRLQSFATVLFAVSAVLVGAVSCRDADATADATAHPVRAPNDSFMVDSFTQRLRYRVRPARPAFVPSVALLAPDRAALVAAAPDRFRVFFETSQGRIEVEVQRAWAPHGVDRLYYLVQHGFFDGMLFYKVQRDAIAQFGFTGDPRVTAAWQTRTIPDDPSIQPHRTGSLAFAAQGPNTRTTMLYFDLNDFGGGPAAPTVVGQTVVGLDVLPRLYDKHGQGLWEEAIIKEGDAYLKRFVNLDYIVRASIAP